MPVFFPILHHCFDIENTIIKDCSSSSSDYAECKSQLENSKDIDDGYPKSDENSSYHSASDALSVDGKTIASSTSGLATVTSSNPSLTNPTNSEVVQKILVSREVNKAIFQPGSFAQQMTFLQLFFFYYHLTLNDANVYRTDAKTNSNCIIQITDFRSNITVNQDIGTINI